MACNSLQLIVPQHNLCLLPGQKVKLHRFESEVWRLQYGWYSWGGNRHVCGWYLTSCDDEKRLKPLQKPDLDDIYCVSYCAEEPKDIDISKLPNGDIKQYGD